jgi:prolipoprotein diacylglyceryltransferase
MSQLIYNFGPWQLRAFTFWVALGVLLSGLIVLALAARRNARLLPYLDVILVAVALGAVGARFGHIALNWSYFALHTDELASLSAGGLNWHGAVLGALIGVVALALGRRLPLRQLLDDAAFSVPIMGAAVWIACSTANAGYGVEVRSLADFPAWLVTETPDVYGVLAPRLALPTLGVALAALVFGGVLVLALARRAEGLRLWLALLIYALGMALLSFFRAEYVPTLLSRRADQVLDLAVALVATLSLASVWAAQVRASIKSPQGAT